MFKRILINILVIANIFLNAPLDILAETPLPDLDVTSVTIHDRNEKCNALNNASFSSQPKPREYVTFNARVVNKDNAPTGYFRFLWKIDGEEVGWGTESSILPGKEAIISFIWLLEKGTRTVEFVADPQDLILEAYEDNNSRCEYINNLCFKTYESKVTQDASLYAQGRILVKFKDDIGLLLDKRLSKDLTLTLPTGIPLLDNGAIRITPVFKKLKENSLKQGFHIRNYLKG